MNNILLKTRSIPNRGNVNILITISEDAYYGYGYGYNGPIDFFNIFGILGTQRGTLVHAIDQVQTLDNYYYGYGYEYSNNISGTNRTKKIDFEIIPEFQIQDGEEFALSLGVVGPASISPQSVITVNKKATCYVVVLDDNDININTKFYIDIPVKTASGTKYKQQSIGETFLNHKDSFFDITVNIEDVSIRKIELRMMSSIKKSNFYSKNIRLRATI